MKPFEFRDACGDVVRFEPDGTIMTHHGDNPEIAEYAVLTPIAALKLGKKLCKWARREIAKVS